MFVSIGNSPSSGSSLLGDLLDSSPISVCGPELNIYTQTSLYNDYNKFKANMSSCSKTSSLYLHANSININRLHHYALNKELLLEIASNSDNSYDFLNNFAKRYSAFRGKKGAIWFEKTPQNIAIVNEYLNIFKNNYFIHIVRNPVYVIPSLIKRGFREDIALFTWLFDVAKVISCKNKRLITIKYEQLVQSPWQITAKIITDVSAQKIQPDTIEQCYYANEYRQTVSRKINTWGVKNYGVIKNANDKKIPDSLLKKIKAGFNYRISDAWAKAYNVPAISYQEAIEYFGYSEDINQLLSRFSNADDTIPVWQNKDKMQLLKRYLYTNIRCNSAAGLITTPIVKSV